MPEQWSHLNLQLSMLAEQEVTENVKMLHTICRKLGLKIPIPDQAVGDLTENTEIAALVDEIEKARDNDALS